MKITSLFSAKAPSLVAGLQGLNMEPVQSPVQVPSSALMIGMCVVYVMYVCACVCVCVCVCVCGWLFVRIVSISIISDIYLINMSNNVRS